MFLLGETTHKHAYISGHNMQNCMILWKVSHKMCMLAKIAHQMCIFGEILVNADEFL